jgi:hypothetical protein
MVRPCATGATRFDRLGRVFIFFAASYRKLAQVSSDWLEPNLGYAVKPVVRRPIRSLFAREQASMRPISTTAPQEKRGIV